MKKNPMKKVTTKKRIKVCFVGSESVTARQAKESAEYILSQLLTKYELTLVATVKEDLLGSEIRKVAKRLQIKTKTHSVTKHANQSNPLELATAALIWEAKRFVVVLGKGKIKGCALYAMEMLSRMNRKAKVFELED